MKGAIFIALGEMVEEQLGIEYLDQAIQKANPESGGVYTAVGTYEDQELFDLVTALAEITNTPAGDLVHAFGVYLFDFLVTRYPQYVENMDSLLEFLRTIDDNIHKEVRILYKNAYLPTIECEYESDDVLLMSYRSKRKLCVLAEGLVAGAAKHFEESVSCEHIECMHDGFERCLIRIKRV